MTNRIDRLTAKARAARWSIDDLDWSLEPVLPATLPRTAYVDMVSQLYHAELAALEVLNRLARELPEPAARQFLATQIADEERHAATYRRYLERIGELAPIDPGLAAIFRFALAGRVPAFALVTALNVVMEHEALAQQQRRIATLPCPLFGAVNRAIVADESRHAGFGVLYLAEALPAVAEAERAAVATWVRQLWAMWCAANENRYVVDGAEVLRLPRAHLDGRWSLLAARLARLGLAPHAELVAAA